MVYITKIQLHYMIKRKFCIYSLQTVNVSTAQMLAVMESLTVCVGVYLFLSSASQ